MAPQHWPGDLSCLTVTLLLSYCSKPSSLKQQEQGSCVMVPRLVHGFSLRGQLGAQHTPEQQQPPAAHCLMHGLALPCMSSMACVLKCTAGPGVLRCCNIAHAH